MTEEIPVAREFWRLALLYDYTIYDHSKFLFEVEIFEGEDGDIMQIPSQVKPDFDDFHHPKVPLGSPKLAIESHDGREL